MWIKLIAGIGIYEALILGLLQAGASDSLIRIFEDFPILGIFLFSLYHLLHWMEKLLEMQQTNTKEIYDGQQVFLTSIIKQMEAKQTRIADRIELLTQQVAVNTATVNEVAQVDNIVSDLIARLEQK